MTAAPDRARVSTGGLFIFKVFNIYYKLGGRRVYVTNITVTKFQLISDIYDEAFRHHI